MKHLTQLRFRTAYFLVQALLSVADGYIANNDGLTDYPTDIPNTSEEIYLWLNAITSVPNDAYIGFTALHTVNMRNNQIGDMPNFVPVAATIRSIGLNNNRITAMPAWFNDLLVLETLNLNNNRITVIPVLDQLTALISFDFGDNLVDTELDTATFVSCTSLERIAAHDFTADPLGTFDVTLQIPANVKYFDIGWSRVTSVSITCIAGPGNCSMKTIVWNNSPLTAIEYGDFKNTIKSFTLMDVDNTVFPSNTNLATDMPMLTYLKIFNTKGRIPSDLGTTNPGLTMLYISRLMPAVDDAQVAYISSLTQLEELDLGFQNIHLFPDLRASAGSMLSISMRATQLTAIPADHLRGLVNLHTLNLSRLQTLISIENFPIGTLTSLASIDLIGNGHMSLNCDCSMSWLKEPPSHLTTISAGGAAHTFCASPSELAGRTFPSLSAADFGQCPTTVSIPEETTAPPVPTTEEASTIAESTSPTESTLAVKTSAFSSISAYNTPLSSETVYTRTRLHCAAICAGDYSCDVFEFYRQRFIDSVVRWYECVLHQVGSTGSETVNVDAESYAVL